MVTIGINGNPGVGKTTFSKMLLKDTANVRLIHRDQIVDRLKDVLPSTATKGYSRDNGEFIKYIRKDSLLYKIKSLKQIGLFIENVKNLYLRREIKKIKDAAIADGIKYLIIEGAKLEEFCDIDDYNYLILVNTDNTNRKARLTNREKNLEDDADKLVDFLFEVRVDNNINYDYVVNNIGTFDDLQAQADIVTDIIKNQDSMVRRRENKKISRNY